MIDTIEKLYDEENFVNYKMTLTNGEVWTVPLDTKNTDYQKIQQWIADGGTVIDNGGGE